VLEIHQLLISVNQLPQQDSMCVCMSNRRGSSWQCAPSAAPVVLQQMLVVGNQMNLTYIAIGTNIPTASFSGMYVYMACFCSAKVALMLNIY
jgi:hypothetical protein